MSALSLIVFLGLMAQDAPPQLSPSDVQKLAMQQLRAAQEHTLAQAQLDSGLCYTVRSYVFRRQDGTAPVLVGTFTCTPADTVRSEQVAKPPRARLVPQ
jgi:hypothetical protein